MGNAQSSIKQNFYITKLTNPDLPICPFIHTIISYNSNNIVDLDPQVLKKILLEKDLTLEIMDIRNSSKFTITIPRGTDKLGLTVVKLSKIPNLLKIRVLAVKESSVVPLVVNDQIIGVVNVFCEDEDELIYHVKTNSSCQLVVLRNLSVEIVDVNTSDLGCEVGLGMLYNASDYEYKMQDYTGKIIRNNTDKDILESKKSSSSKNEEEVKKEITSSDQRPTQENVVDHSNNGGILENKEDVTKENSDILKDTNHSNNENIGSGQLLSDSCDLTKNDNLKSDIPIIENMPTYYPDNLTLEQNFAQSCNLKENNEDVNAPKEGNQDLNASKSLNPLGQQRTASYVYKPSNKFIESRMSLEKANQQKISEEAGVPEEAQYLIGSDVKDPNNTTHLIGDSFRNKNDFVEKDGQLKMKDDAYEANKQNHATNIKELFDDGTIDTDTDDFDFNAKKDGNSI